MEARIIAYGLYDFPFTCGQVLWPVAAIIAVVAVIVIIHHNFTFKK